MNVKFWSENLKGRDNSEDLGIDGRMHKTRERHEIHLKCWLENLKGRVHSEDLGIDGRISEWVLTEIGWEAVDLIHMAEDRHQWRAVVNTV
jgi:hypothetical protein